MKKLANFPSADLTHHRSALDHFQLAAFVFVPSPPPPTKNSFFSFYCEREFSNRPKKDTPHSHNNPRTSHVIFCKCHALNPI